MKQNSNNWKNEQSDEFYHELDDKTSRHSCCTCQTLTILFIFFLVVIIGMIFYFYWQITRGGGLNIPSYRIASNQDFNQKIENPDVSGNQVRVVLTTEEFNTALNKGLSFDNFILKDMTLSINPAEILIYGNLIKPLSSKILLIGNLHVEDGKIKLMVNKATAGNITLPRFVDQKVAESLNAMIDQRMAKFYEKYSATEVNLDQNKIIIDGKIK